MSNPDERVTPLILEELARGERRVLSLTVAVGKAMPRTGHVKGSLQSAIESALRNLLAAEAIMETGDGVYSLARRRAISPTDRSQPADEP